MESTHYAHFEDANDKEDVIIDRLAADLLDVPVLRPCDGIVEPTEAATPQVPSPSQQQASPLPQVPSPSQQQASPLPQVPSPSQPTPNDVGGGLGFSASFHSPPSRDQRLEAVEKEVREMKNEIYDIKNMFKVMAADISSLVKNKETEGPRQTPERRQTRARKQPWWMVSPSWTSGKRKRRAGPVNAESVLKKLKARK